MAPAIRAGLADGLHVYAVDNIGMGDGRQPDFEYSLSYFVDFIREVQDQLGYAKTNIVGHSLGGWIAATFAYESPDRVRKLVLDNIAGMNPTPPDTVSNFQLPTEETVKAQVEANFRPEDHEQQAFFHWRNVQQPGAETAFRRITQHLNDPVMRRRYYLRRQAEQHTRAHPRGLGRDRQPALPIDGGTGDSSHDSGSPTGGGAGRHAFHDAG